MLLTKAGEGIGCLCRCFNGYQSVYQLFFAVCGKTFVARIGFEKANFIRCTDWQCLRLDYILTEFADSRVCTYESECVCTYGFCRVSFTKQKIVF